MCVERVDEVKKYIVECIKSMRKHGIRVSLDKKRVNFEYERFEKALTRRLRSTLKGFCEEVDVSAEWYEPERMGIDVVCKSGGGEVEYFVNAPVVIEIDTSSLSERDVEIVE